MAKKAPRKASAPLLGPVSLEEARALAGGPAPARAPVKGAGIAAATPQSVEKERERLRAQRALEDRERIRNYKATMTIMKERGVKGLPDEEADTADESAPPRRRAPGPARAAARPLQILAEGDSWFDYPVPFFGGGIIKRLETRLGIPILNLAKAGDEVRYMLGVDERRQLIKQLRDGCPAGGPWEVMLFSGGGNDIVDNPMVLWLRQYQGGVPAKQLINQPRYDIALALVRAAYEDLIALRDALSPTTHLFFHAYDFAIPDGRGVCGKGPWLKPSLDMKGVPANSPVAAGIVKEMLMQFATMMENLEGRHPLVTVINGQGTLAPVTNSWHNELHPSKAGFSQFADLFHAKLKAAYPGRVL